MRPPTFPLRRDNLPRTNPSYLLLGIRHPPTIPNQRNAPRRRSETRCRPAAAVGGERASSENGRHAIWNWIAGRRLIPAEFRSDHIKERASAHILTLQAAGQNVRGYKATARGH